MTNRQWLLEQMQNMSDEELYEQINLVPYLNCANVKCAGISCRECVKGWLQSEHKEPIKLSDAERIILENVDEEYKWIARDKNGYLKASKDKPEKECVTWERCHGYVSMCAFNHLFQFIKWEDTEPYNIEELLKGK
jgi:hypothetical protein